MGFTTKLASQFEARRHAFNPTGDPRFGLLTVGQITEVMACNIRDYTGRTILPVVNYKRRPHEGHGNVGFIWDFYGPTTVFLCNTFQIPKLLKDVLALPKETYPYPDQLVDAGWLVD